MLLESFANASIGDPFLMLIFVGQGPLEFELKKRADELNIHGKVIFGGVREDVGAGLFSSFRHIVLPSFIEGLSNALLEAMTAGRASYAAISRVNRQLVANNMEGLLINPKIRHLFHHALNYCHKIHYCVKKWEIMQG